MKRTLPLLLVALAALQTTAAGQAPGRLRGIGGRSGFQSDSKVVFRVAPDAPHILEAVYLYPDRTRWLLRLDSDPPEPPTRYYRFGAQAWINEPGAATSAEYTGHRRTNTVLQMELRRALMLWPLGFNWQDEKDGTQSADVFMLQRLKKEAPIGSLHARFGPLGTRGADSQERGQRPLAIRALRTDGIEVEELRVSEWQEFDDRWWPRALSLYTRGEEVWHETILSIRTRRVPVDLFFQPPERRPKKASLVVGTPIVRNIDLSPLTLREIELEHGIEWPAALAQAHEWIQKTRQDWGDDGPALDPVPSFRLDEHAKPTHCLLRLAKAMTPAPSGWTTLRDRPGLALVLDDLVQLRREPLDLLQSQAPKGGPRDSPYCRILRPEGPRGVQLYLPLATESP